MIGKCWNKVEQKSGRLQQSQKRILAEKHREQGNKEENHDEKPTEKTPVMTPQGFLCAVFALSLGDSLRNRRGGNQTVDGLQS